MKKVAESCQGTTTNHTAGNTSQTGTNVLDRTLKNAPANERVLRGDMESLRVFHEREMRLFPLETLKRVLEAHGVEFVEEGI